MKELQTKGEGRISDEDAEVFVGFHAALANAARRAVPEAGMMEVEGISRQAARVGIEAYQKRRGPVGVFPSGASREFAQRESLLDAAVRMGQILGNVPNEVEG